MMSLDSELLLFLRDSGNNSHGGPTGPTMSSTDMIDPSCEGEDMKEDYDER